MVDSIIKLSIVVDLILTVLISASSSKFNGVFLPLDRSHFERLLEELFYIRHRRIEGRQDKRFSGCISKCLVHRVKVELSEAIPWLVIVVNFLIAVEPAGVVVGELRPDHFLLFVIKNVFAYLVSSLHPRVFQHLRYT